MNTKRQTLHLALDKMLNELERVEQNTDMLDLSLSTTQLIDEEDSVIRIATLTAEIIEASDGSAAVEEAEIRTALYQGDDLQNAMRTELDLD